MRRRVVLILALALLLAGCASSTAAVTAKPEAAKPAALPERVVQAGGVEVTVRPTRVDAGGAAFSVSFDTHSGSLDVPLPAAASLTVAGRAWPAAGWSGPGAGGHHREGVLTFTAKGAATGQVVLRLARLPAPVALQWDLGMA